MSLSGAAIGVLAAAGLLLVAMGVVGVPDDEPGTRAVEIEFTRQMATRLLGSLGVGLFVWWLTGWFAAGASLAAIMMMVPLFFDAHRQRERAVQRAEALAMWSEMMRDTIATHAGLQQAITITSAVVPDVIRLQVRELSLRSAQMPLQDALAIFAADVADPVADKIVAALSIADRHQARNLPKLLGEIATTTREQAMSRQRVETGRAKTYASARSMVILTGLMVVMLAGLSPTFMEPYDTLTGQVVLAVVGALFVGAVWALIQLGRPVPEPRVLAGVAKELSR